jgi:hypothetical protein
MKSRPHCRGEIFDELRNLEGPGQWHGWDAVVLILFFFFCSFQKKLPTGAPCTTHTTRYRPWLSALSRQLLIALWLA